MSIGLLQALLMLSFPALAGLGWAGLQISNAQRRDARLAARILAVTSTGRSRPAAAASIARAAPVERQAPLGRALRLFGCDFVRRDVYPLPWWAVLLIALATGRAAVALLSGLAGTIAWAAWPIVFVMVSRSMFGHWDGKRRDVLVKQMPDALAMIVRGVRVGIPTTEAIRMVGREAPAPTGPEFARIAEEVAIGTPLDAALREAAGRTGLPEYRFFATALSLQAQTGGGLSETLETLADVIRKRVALRARGYALTSEARTSTLVLCAMPFLIMATLLVVNPPYVMVMFNEQTGRMLLGLCGVLLVSAVFVMRRMIRATLA